MGMYDILTATVACPKCQAIFEDELQFKAYFGRYEPDLRHGKIGAPYPDFPKIPVVEVDACASHRCTPTTTGDGTHFFFVAIKFVRGTPVDIRLLDEKATPMIGQPGPRSAETHRRRTAAEEERYRRRVLAHEREMHERGITDPAEQMAYAACVPIQALVDYVGWARQVFRDARDVGPYTCTGLNEPGKRWRRLTRKHVLAGPSGVLPPTRCEVEACVCDC